MAKKKSSLSRPSQVVLALLAVLVIGIAGGWLGAALRGGTGGGAAAAEGSFLQDIRDRGELRVGVAVAPPMTAEQPDGSFGGPFLIPLENLAASLGVPLVAVPADWSNIVAGLQAGRYDAAAYLDSTTERSLSIQFSDPVYTYQGVFIVKADSPYLTSGDLVGAGEIAIAQGTAYQPALVEQGYQVLEVDKIPNAVAAVNAGRAQAAFADLPAALGAVQGDDSLKIIVPDPVIYQIASGFGLPQDIDAYSLQVINIAISNAQNSGEFQRALDAVGLLSPDSLGDFEKR